MHKVLNDFSVGKYRVLKLDGEMPKENYHRFLIDGKHYDVVPIYDAQNCVAIEATGSFKGKTVEFQ